MSLLFGEYAVAKCYTVNIESVAASDFFEIAILLGSCFIVNYVTADAKTNWAEGFAMVSFYAMIVRASIHNSDYNYLTSWIQQALCTWFYSGQPEIKVLLSCGSVQEALASLAAGATGVHGE